MFALQTYIIFKHLAVCNHLYTDNYKTNKAIHYFPSYTEIRNHSKNQYIIFDYCALLLTIYTFTL